MVTAMVVAVVVAMVSMAAEQELGTRVGRPPPQGAQLPPELPYPYRLTLPLPPDPTPTAWRGKARPEQQEPTLRSAALYSLYSLYSLCSLYSLYSLDSLCPHYA